MFLIAHRANDNHDFSENSQNAIVDCLNKDYIVGIEIDVRITKDRKLVLIHDPIIDFISNGRGIVKHMMLAELRKYQYGKSSEPLVTLEEVLKKYTDKILLIELKEIGNDYISLATELVKLLNKYPDIDVYICSFNFRLLNYLKNNYPYIKCGLIIGYGLNKLSVNNTFDFLVLSSSNLYLSNKKDSIFVFGLKKEELKKITKDVYLITDESYRLSK